jgi:hypothetical protein
MCKEFNESRRGQVLFKEVDLIVVEDLLFEVLRNVTCYA